MGVTRPGKTWREWTEILLGVLRPTAGGVVVRQGAWRGPQPRPLADRAGRTARLWGWAAADRAVRGPRLRRLHQPRRRAARPKAGRRHAEGLDAELAI